MNNILKRLDGETEDQTLWRIGKAKSNGVLGDITWPEIADFMNKEFREDECSYYDSSAYRKKFKNFSDAYDGIFSKEQFTELQMRENEAQIKEMFKAKKQWEDQRRECKKLWTSEARFEHLTNKLVDAVNNLCNVSPLEFEDLYDGEEFVDDCEINPSAYQGELLIREYLVKKAETTQRVIGSFEMTGKESMGLMELLLKINADEKVRYYSVIDEEGQVLISENSKKAVTDSFTYIALEKKDLEMLQILCFDQDKKELYKAYFDVETYEIYVMEE